MVFRINGKNKNSVTPVPSYEEGSKYLVFPKFLLIHDFLAQSGSITEKLLFIKVFHGFIGSLSCENGSSKMEAHVRLRI